MGIPIKYTRQGLINELLRFEDEKKRLPVQRDMSSKKGYPSIKTYVKHFGSWINAINETPFKNKVLIKSSKESETYTKEELMTAFIRYKNENNKLPAKNVFKKKNGYPSSWHYERIFGSWNNALMEIFSEIKHNKNKKPPLILYKTKQLNARYFFSPQNLNPRKLYLIGYLISDGCIHGHQIKFATTEKDKELIYEIKEYMNSKCEVKINDIPNNKVYTLTITDAQMSEDLRLYGVVERKSFVSYIPFNYLKTPEDEAAIMRGIFDGDGSISFQKRKGYHAPVFLIYGSEQLCKDYLFLLKKNCNIDGNIEKHKSIHRIHIGGLEKCQKIYDFLYSYDNFYMKRKKERFEKLLNCTFTKETDPYYVN